MCTTRCTKGVKANLEMIIWVSYLRYTIEMQSSFKRKLLAEKSLKRLFVTQSKGTGLVSKCRLRPVSNNKSGAFFI